MSTYTITADVSKLAAVLLGEADRLQAALETVVDLPDDLWDRTDPFEVAHQLTRQIVERETPDERKPSEWVDVEVEAPDGRKIIYTVRRERAAS